MFEMLNELSHSFDAEIVIKQSGYLEDASLIQEAAFLTTQACSDEKNNVSSMNKEIAFKDKKILNEIQMLISKGDKENAFLAIDEILECFSDSNHAEYGLGYLFAEISINMINITRGFGVDLKRAEINYLLTIREIDKFSKFVKQLIERCIDKVFEQKVVAKSDFMKDVIKYIDENYMDYNISLDQLASLFEVTQSSLSTSFKEEIGINYKEYIILKRIEYSKLILRTQDITVKELCKEVGYVNVSHFIRNFKKITGMTPLVYKNSLSDFIN